MPIRMRAMGVALFVVMLVSAVGAAKGPMGQQTQPTHPLQSPQTSNPMDTSGLNIPGANAPDPGKEKLDANRAKAASDDRHKRLQEDSAKLLQMATDLKMQVDKTPKDELSLIVVRKATDIEKLAHDIRVREVN